MRRLLPLFLILIPGFINAQNNVGIGTQVPDPSAVLELQSTNSGLLVPRMSAIQRLAIPHPKNSLLVFDTDSNCFVYYITSGNTWINMCKVTGAGGVTGAQGPTGPT